MVIRIGFFTLVVRRSDIETHYPGGVEGFTAQYPHRQMDETLVSLGSMSGGETREDIEALVAVGIGPERMALLEKVHGLFEPADWIELGRIDDRNVCWEKGHAPASFEPWKQDLFSWP